MHKGLLTQLVILVILCVCCIDLVEAAEQECTFLENLSDYQKEIATMSYHAGLPYDLGLTAVAIAWKESRLGLYKVRYNTKNIKDQSFGIMHTVGYWKTKEMSSFEAGIWVMNMIDSPEFSISVGVQDILYWQNRAKGDWKKGVAMYNAGSYHKAGLPYANDIVKVVNTLKGCKL